MVSAHNLLHRVCPQLSSFVLPKNRIHHNHPRQDLYGSLFTIGASVSAYYCVNCARAWLAALFLPTYVFVFPIHTPERVWACFSVSAHNCLHLFCPRTGFTMSTHDWICMVRCSRLASLCLPTTGFIVPALGWLHCFCPRMCLFICGPPIPKPPT